MDDGKLPTLEQVREEGGGGGTEASHPGGSRVSTGSGSQQADLGAR